MAAPNADQFETYFRRADLDGDGRISGAEAVSFFQGSNLPKQVLAQVWAYADQAKTGFLGRNEFYNALRLVTVAQSKRDLTPDIVKAALYSPAAAKIPAPQINLAAIPPPRPNSVATNASVGQMGVTAPLPHPNSVGATASVGPMGVTAPTSSQSFVYRGQGLAGPVANPQYFPSQQSPGMRPQSMPASSAPRPQQGLAGPDISRGVNMAVHSLSNPGISNDWNGVRPGIVAARPGGTTPAAALPTSTSLSPVPPMPQSTTVNTKALAVSGNGFSSSSVLGNDLFSAASSAPKQEPSGQGYSVSSVSSAIVPVSSGAQPASKQNSLDSLQGAISSMLPTNSQFHRAQSAPNINQQISPPASSSPLTSSGISVGLGNNNSDNSQLSWQKMKPSDVQKYMKVFMEVDTDRDGKITGEQARSLFLSWRLPIDILKKVWDLSDQDNDSMLSLREFCFALYLMERYREGRPLPQSLPNSVMYDETLMSMTGHPKISYGNAGWGMGTGFQQQQGMPGARPVAPAAGLRPPVPGSSAQADGTTQPNQQKSGTPVLEDSFLNPTDNGERNILNSNPQEATSAEKKAEETQNVILDSKEKIELYRNKMQELVLYKSRCDNRLNEITERASADKREAESLGKKYEEKYKQVGEIASKLTIEEAKFRDIQERKVELQQAIVKMEQGGSADGILQVRAERIQSDLEELFKALAERCKKHGIDVKSITMVQLPAGWQPGISESAALWDEDWDKFEDEGFANDLTFDAKNASSKPKPAFIHGVENFSDENTVHDSPVNANGKQDNSANGDYAVEDESYAHSEDDLRRSPRDSPAGRTTVESPSQVFSNAHFGKGSEADAETHSFDESTWGGAFDNNDDVDSVWGFKTKDTDMDQQGDFFKSGDFGINPVKTGSGHSDGTFQTKSPFTFDDSVPGTPLSKFGNSPRYSEAGDHFFDMSRFDSFSMHEGGYSPQPERLTRFDSISSSKDFGFNNEKFTRFDSMSSSKDFGYSNDNRFTRFDSMSSSKDFGYNHDNKFTRFDSMSSNKDFGHNPERLTRFDSMSSSKDFDFSRQGHARFDSISSTKDFGHSGPFSFDDSDPFGSSGPFKVSSENQSPKKGSDSWSAF
ncbi:actin cytoskeleton-regulatory complex protein pan1 isoform X2 [Abrus precatorius]|uniref:Actin cytoskeleton-regulatory complex protein pan1 isoform X2 n=1 Tax=Abrus precatorius TaxID=3816 RepID=A0A8B8LFW7_ABRPR|nr:actin cytoskeleton-regulatory complex protein pan1 isoform X2 [Abrus precatorius]